MGGCLGECGVVCGGLVAWWGRGGYGGVVDWGVSAYIVVSGGHFMRCRDVQYRCEGSQGRAIGAGR